MIRKLLQRLTDTSDGGKHLPWITRRVMAWLSGFDTDKYWHRQFIVANPKAKVNPLLKAYYLLWIKRVDSKHNCSSELHSIGACEQLPPLFASWS